MARSINLRVSAVMLAAGALLLALAGPVAAAPTSGGGGLAGHSQLANGVVCGAVTAFTAPTVAADGSITIGGVTDPVDATATITPQALAALSGTLPLTTCLTLTVTGSGDATEVTGIAIAASGQLCGAVTATGTGTARIFSIGGAAVPTSAVNAELAALLNAALAANATVCVDVTVDANTGMLTAAANLDATFQLCGQVVGSGAAGARTYTVAGLAIPSAQLSASEAAALELAIANNANACVDLVIVDSQITAATARVDACVTVGAVSATSVTLDGVVIPLPTGSTVSSEIRTGATLGVRVAINATTGAVTVSVITFGGCTVAAAQLPNTSVGGHGATAPAVLALGMLALASALALVPRRREDVTA